ncbi:TPA: lysozyme, partial [Enterobacter kobei]|nr:lysozyme [Enterobacter kobei]HDT5469501.1 lysozyme [Enterobacter kobei]HEP0396812.1 lysozyme [Enterobacter kobei]
MQTSDKGIALIKQFEGCRLTAYQDSVGVWTIGYGWTQPVDGKPIRAGMTIKQET